MPRPIEYAAPDRPETRFKPAMPRRGGMMDYKSFRRLVLEHLDQYAVAGVEIPDTYNNQADDTSRIPGLTNIALRTIATQTAPILATVDPNAEGFEGKTNMQNGWTKIEMPQDFWRLTGQGMPRCSADGSFSRTMEYVFFSDRELLFRTSDMPGMMLTYYRYPRKCHGNFEEILDCSEAAADAASFYVAAELAREDSPYAYQCLYNEYESMLARLLKPMTAEFVAVKDVYGFTG